MVAACFFMEMIKQRMQHMDREVVTVFNIS